MTSLSTQSISGTVPNKISSVSVILQQKAGLSNQVNQGMRRRSWWKPGELLQYYAHIFDLENYFFHIQTYLYSIRAELYLSTISFWLQTESNTAAARKFSDEELPYVNWKIQNFFYNW